MARPLRVAVIGAGVGGLVAARELKKDSHKVVVYEKSDRIGGVWVYDPRVEEDPLGCDPNREIVHSSLYGSVRTTIPSDIMGFSDYPFNVTSDVNGGILKEFPSHEEVLQFLNNFVRDFGLMDLIRISTQVVRVEQVMEYGPWIVEGRQEINGVIFSSEEYYDAVVVCNGHFTQPKLPQLQGIEKWPGKQIHSHNYRVPKPFENKIVAVIGYGPSAHDILLEISKVAEEVHMSSRTPSIASKKLENYHNIWLHPKIVYCYKNGDISFQDGTMIRADAIIHCTGYKYAFPFLRTNGVITIDDNRVGPLYKHIFPPKLAPSLSFVGIPNMANNFLMMEIQAKWIVSVLSGKSNLPSEEEMLADVEEHYKQMKNKGIPGHHTHKLPSNQFEYIDWVAAQAGLPPIDDEIKKTTERLLSVWGDSWIGYRERYIELTMKTR
ncbi:OLC1v1009733C1 [Oldenlandia corymbosa var. corymbosa]|uniref:Flavin-containing monooxygenase n=1 Tax=Oldenlandia corymbosa var. corymbosa TaxID=529605 RepID=A0AAV1DPP0_OLDCO|nr:OLC1v1009733C1 [Oldenlandia corymbosa var. corymbosa]